MLTSRQVAEWIAYAATDPALNLAPLPREAAQAVELDRKQRRRQIEANIERWNKKQARAK